MQNALSQLAMGNSMNTGNGSGMNQLSPLASAASMSPVAMNNYMGNPMDNGGANMMPFLQSQQNFNPSGMQGSMQSPLSLQNTNLAPYVSMHQSGMPNPSGRGFGAYAHGGMVRMQEGGMPEEAMMEQGMQGGDQSSPLSMASDEGELDPALVEQVQMAVQFIQKYLDQMGEGYILCHINGEEYQVLAEQFGDPEMITENLAKFDEGGMVDEDLAEASEAVAGAGEAEDDPHLVALSQDQMAFMIENFGEPNLNQMTGLPQFGFFKKIAKVVKSVVKNPIVQAIAPIALNAFAPGIGSALGGALGLGATGTSALLGGGMGLLGGGGLKGALSGAAMGALGQTGADFLGGSGNPFSGVAASGGESGGGFMDSLRSGVSNVGKSLSNVFTPTPESQFTNVNGLNVLKSDIASQGGQGGGIGSGLLNVVKNNPMTSALAGATLLGGLGGPKQQANQAVPTPQVADATKLPNWQLNRQLANRDDLDAQRAGGYQGELNYFKPIDPLQGAFIPQVAKRGGMIHRYADGGMVDDEVMVTPKTRQGMRKMPKAPPLNYLDDMHSALYAMPLAGVGGPSGQGMMPQGMTSQQQQMPQQQGALNAMAGMQGANQMAGRAPQMMAGGGMFYDRGGLLSGAGDGVSDDIHAVIGGRQPARLSGGEFVVPSKIVSELGNGSTEAGAKQLYEMIDRVNQRRLSSKDYAKDTKAYQHLPA